MTTAEETSGEVMLEQPAATLAEEEYQNAERAIGRPSVWMLTTQGMLGLGLLWIAHAQSQSAERQAKLQAAAEARGRELAGLKTELSTLRGQLEGLSKRVDTVRQTVASDTSEDVIFLKALALKPDLDPKLAREIARSVRNYSRLYGQDPDLALSIIKVESNFNPKIVSNMGAVGLMQVMPQWKRVLGIEGALSDPDTSIKYGLQILGFYQEMYKDLDMALTAYNRGPGPVDNALLKGKDYKNKYAPRIRATYRRLKAMSVADS